MRDEEITQDQLAKAIYNCFQKLWLPCLLEDKSVPICCVGISPAGSDGFRQYRLLVVKPDEVEDVIEALEEVCKNYRQVVSGFRGPDGQVESDPSRN